MNAQNKYSHLALPTLRTHEKVKKGYFVITLESFTNSILSKQKFSFLRKLKLCILKKMISLELPILNHRKAWSSQVSRNFINCQLESHFWHHVVKGEILQKQKWTPHLFNTPHAGAIYNNFKVYHIICSEKERRAGHELRTNVSFKKKYTSIL